jgi:hypothetical protein
MAPRKFNHEAIVEYLLSNPDCTAADAALHFGASVGRIKQIARLYDIAKRWLGKQEK